MDETVFDVIKEHFQETYKNVFPRDTGQFERHFKDTIELEVSQNLLRLVHENASITSDSKILDLGCGFGTFVLVCRKGGYEAYGVDVAEYEIEFARKRIKTELPTYCDDEVYQLSSAESLPFEDTSFDIVTLWNLLEHVPDYRKVLKEADRLLKPGGYLFLITPNYLSLREEPHYHLLWFPLLPKRLGKLYLKLRGRDPSFLMNSIFYVTNCGVLKWLRKNKYRLIIPELVKVTKPDLVSSKRKAAILRAVSLFKMTFLLKFVLYLSFFNPFRRGIFVCAKKKY